MDAEPAPAARAAPAGLSTVQVAEMYKNCIKLAAENKISQKNTWSLNLIDHMSDLVKPDKEGVTTNFQHASCTLDAGIKIYSHRVDSVHSEAFKVLGGLSRSAGAAEDEADGPAGEGEGDGEQSQGGGRRRRAAAADADPCSTLESSFEALNVKKVDLAFAVDPLFHKTSAQFDEGGAQGLLLNNLSVYHGCEIVFDSSDVPDKALSAVDHGNADVQVDLSSLQQQLQVVRDAPADAELAPSLAAISDLLGQVAVPDAAAAAAHLVAEVAEGREASGATELATGMQQLAVESGNAAQQLSADGQPANAPDEYSDDGYDGGDACGYSDAGSPAPADDSSCRGADAGADGGAEASSRGPNCVVGSSGGAVDGSANGSSRGGGLSEQAVQWLLEAGTGAGPVTRGAGWAGASHWRYRAEPDAAAADKPKPARRQRKVTTIDFENLPPLSEDTFKLATRKEQICVKTLAPKDTLLPEDLHFEAKQLAELFLKPGRPVTRSMTRAARGEATNGGAEAGYASSDDGGGGFDYGGASDDELDGRDAWGAVQAADQGADGDLISVPRKVANTSIAYARASKQVDVRRLKEALWLGIRQLSNRQRESPDGEGQPPADVKLRFQDVISRLDDSSGAGRLADLSVHLCFICLLHLANEHGLAIADGPDLRTLTISGIPAR